MERKAGRQKIRGFMDQTKESDRKQPLSPSPLHQCKVKMSETFLMIKQASERGHTRCHGNSCHLSEEQEYPLGFSSVASGSTEAMEGGLSQESEEWFTFSLLSEF